MTEPIAALYLRSAAGDDDSMDEQRRSCEGLAASHGWRGGEIFVDNGSSGIFDRWELESLRGCIRSGRFEAIVTVDPVRNACDAGMVPEFIRF